MQVILLLLITLTSYAQDKVLIEKVLQGEVQPKLEDCPPENSKKACLEAICGKASERKSYVDIYQDLANSKKEYNELDKYKELLKKKIEDDLKEELERIKNVREVTKEDTEIDPELLNLLNTFRILSYNEIISECEDCILVDKVELDDKKGTFKFPLDLQKLETFLKKELQKSNVNEEVNNIVKIYNNINLMRLTFGSQYGWELLLSITDPGKKIAEIIDSKILDIEELRKNIQKDIPSLPWAKSMFVNDNLIKKLRSNDYSETDLEMFLTSYYGMKLFESFLFDKSKESSKKIKVSSWYNLKKINENIDNYEKELLKINEKKDEYVMDNLNHCMAVFKNNMETLPSKEDLNYWKDKIKKEKDEFRGKFFNLLSQHSASLLKPKFDELMISYPKSQDDFFNKLDDDIMDLNSNAELFDHKSSDYSKFKKQEIISQISDFLKNNNDSFKTAWASSCDDLAIDGLSDKSLSLAGGKVQVSSFSLKSPQDQKGIFFHELAHATSYLIKNTNLSEKSVKKYVDVNKCVSSGFPEGDKSTSYLSYKDDKSNQHYEQYQRTQFMEENWADYVSANLLNQNDVNFACFLQGKEVGDYKDFDVYPKESDTDTHAPVFYRALSIYQVKNGSLPEACQKSLSAKEIGDVSKQCKLKDDLDAIKK